MSDFLLDFLPSFYRKVMVDDNGQSLLIPIFDQYMLLMGDAIYQAQQISQYPYLETINPLLHEMYVTVNITNGNSYDNGFLIDSDIVSYGSENFYYDALFTKPCSASYDIMQDRSTGKKYLQIDSDDKEFRMSNVLFAKQCYRDKQILQKTYGKLFKHVRPINGYQSDIINFNNIKNDYNVYKQELLAYQYIIFKGCTIQNLKNALCILTGKEQYLPFDGKIVSINGNYLVFQNIVSPFEEVEILTSHVGDFSIGMILEKYSTFGSTFTIYDIFSNPARFTHYLLAHKAETLINLLSINTVNKEDYATLHWDGNIAWDAENLYWDMGNHAGVDDTPGGEINHVYEYPSNDIERTLFTDYTDNRFDSQKIYEMFRNVFIVEGKNLDQGTSLVIQNFVNRFKPIYTKCLFDLLEIGN